MTSLGYKERYSKLKKYKKIFSCLFYSFLCLFLIDAVIFILLVTYESFNKAYFVNLPICVVVSLCFAFSVSSLSFLKKEINFLENIFSQYMNIINGNVVNISDSEITIKGRKILEVKLIDNNEEIVVYFENIFGEVPFKEKDKVSLKISDNFILEYEVESL